MPLRFAVSRRALQPAEGAEEVEAELASARRRTAMLEGVLAARAQWGRVQRDPRGATSQPLTCSGVSTSLSTAHDDKPLDNSSKRVETPGRSHAGKAYADGMWFRGKVVEVRVLGRRGDAKVSIVNACLARAARNLNPFGHRFYDLEDTTQSTRQPR